MIDLLSLGRLTSGYGKRTSPTAGASTNHKGIDIVLSSDAVPSVSAGTVTAKGYTSSTGNYVKIKDAAGNILSYFHLASSSPLAIGQTVSEGQTVGTQGTTGISTGKHLHFQVNTASGGTMSPLDYLSGATGTVSDASTVSTVSTGVSTGVSTTSGILANAAGSIVKVIAVLLICVLAAVFFLKSFKIKLGGVI